MLVIPSKTLRNRKAQEHFVIGLSIYVVHTSLRCQGEVASPMRIYVVSVRQYDYHEFELPSAVSGLLSRPV